MSVDGGHLAGIANLIAQSEALARGQDTEAVAESLTAAGCRQEEIERLLPHKLHPGNRPSNILLLRQLDPTSLGMLLAMYEHQVFVQAVIWGVNPFDQWGVELGKLRAGEFARFLADGESDKLPGIGEKIFQWLK